MTLNFTDGGFFRNGRKAEAQERLGVAVDVFVWRRRDQVVVVEVVV